MNVIKGTIIVVEGLDGSGKNTTSLSLHNKLKEVGVNKLHPDILSYPDYITESGMDITEYLNGNPKYNNLDGMQISKLYTLNRVESFYDGDQPLIDVYDNGYIFVSDRYSTSNILYQTREVPDNVFDAMIHAMKISEHEIHCIPKPNITFFLNMPSHMAIESIKGRGVGVDKRPSVDILENLETFEAIYKRVDRIIEKEGWIVIDVYNNAERRSVEDITNEIFDHLVRLNVIQ